MSRVIATELQNGTVIVTIQKSVNGAEPRGYYHAASIRPGDDPVGVRDLINADLTARLNCGPLDKSWDETVLPLVSALYPKPVRDAFAAAHQDYVPMTLALSAKITAVSASVELPSAPVTAGIV